MQKRIEWQAQSDFHTLLQIVLRGLLLKRSTKQSHGHIYSSLSSNVKIVNSLENILDPGRVCII